MMDAATKSAIRDEKHLQAMIDTASIGNPSLKQRLTIASAWMLMQLPAASLGWTKEIEMSQEIRQMSVIMHMRLEALPGFKHILWMGNGFYATTAYWTYRVNREVKRLTGPDFRPLTPDEKSMYGILDGDLCCQVFQNVELDGVAQTWTGTGIIGADELRNQDSKGKPMPGLQSTKDRMKTLKTRAVHDMYSRAYSIEGVTNSAEDMEGAERAALEAAPSGQATTVVAVNEKYFKDADRQMHQEIMDLIELKMQQLMQNGKTRLQIEEEIGTTFESLDGMSNSQLMAVLGVVDGIK